MIDKSDRPGAVENAINFSPRNQNDSGFVDEIAPSRLDLAIGPMWDDGQRGRRIQRD
jgi:hypothetical protein